MSSGRLSVLVFAVCLAGVSTARADVVGPPTLKCPEGFPVQSCHGTEYCGFTTCTTQDQCPANSACAEQRWCIHEFYCGRWLPDATVPMTQTYEGSCAKGESCAKGTCKTIRACTPVLPDRGCSCQLGDAPGDGPAAVLLVLGLGLVGLGLLRRTGAI